MVTTDDVDGSANAEAVTFAFDGINCEVDLSQKNRAKLEKAVAPYIEAGRRVTRSRRRPGAGRQEGPRVDRAAVRSWARENGLKVSERGRISAEIMQQYEAAH